MKSLLISSLTIGALAMLCCTKNLPAAQPNNGTADTTQLKKLELDAQHYRTFAYDSIGRFKRMDVWSLAVNDYVDATYEGSNKIGRIHTNDFQVKPIYTADKVTSIGFIQHQLPDNDEPDLYRTLQYDGNKITESRRYEIKNGSEVNIDKYNFTYYPNGDVKEIRLLYYNSGQKNFQLHSVWQLEYDEMKNSLQKAVHQFPWLYDHYEMFDVYLPGTHNITKVKQYDNNGQLTFLKTYSYTYSTARYPLTASENWFDPNTTEPTYTRSMKYYY